MGLQGFDRAVKLVLQDPVSEDPGHQSNERIDANDNGFADDLRLAA